MDNKDFMDNMDIYYLYYENLTRRSTSKERRDSCNEQISLRGRYISFRLI